MIKLNIMELIILILFECCYFCCMHKIYTLICVAIFGLPHLSILQFLGLFLLIRFFFAGKSTQVQLERGGK